LIQDLICEFTDSLEKPRFTPAEIEGHKDRILSVLYTPLMKTGASEMLLKNIDENFRLAWEIRSSNRTQ